MPLQIRRRPDTGSLEIYGRVRPAGAKTGIRVRQRAGSDDPALAREEAVAIEFEIIRRHLHGDRPRTRSFSVACEAYIKAAPRTERTIVACMRLIPFFGEMPLDRIKPDVLDQARVALCREGASNGTFLRNVVAPVRAIMNFAHGKEWGPAPRFRVEKDKARRAPGFLTPAQAEALIAAAAGHLQPLLRFLLCTGCRLGEALKLDWRSVDLIGQRVTLWEGETKSGDRRTIWLVPAAMDTLQGIAHRTGPVFLTGDRKPYRTSENYGGQIKKGWATACRNTQLSGITPHSTRHTWASWHYAVHQDLLKLRTDGGWASTLLVERYAHLMPAGEEAAIQEFWGMPTSNVEFKYAQHQ